MKRLFSVEPIVALYMLANVAGSILIQQYIYRKIWENETNSSYIENENSSNCYQNDSIYSKQQVVQEKSSHYFMTMNLVQFFPGLIITLVLGGVSDRYGRKLFVLLPSIGALINSLANLAVAYFSWSLYILFPSVILTACFGGPAALFAGAFAYVADVSSNKQKNMRMALLDMILGVMGGIGALSSGYYLKAAGFNWPFLTITLINLANIVYIIFFFEESAQVPRTEQDQISFSDKFKEILSRIFIIFTSSDFRKCVQIGLLLLALSTFALAEFGALGLYTLYELNAPLCWNEILIGAGSATDLAIFLLSFCGVTIFSYHLGDIFIIFIGILSFVGGMIMAFFATTTLLMFLVRLVSLFAFMPFPVLRSMLSKSVLPSDQGALFALVACLESLSGTISTTIFNNVYAATVEQFAGFVFLLAACLCLIPFGILCVLFWWKPEEEEYTRLITEEESS
ncbi:solute carrier family 46 member 3-like isoform X2 [Pristis pectinata]|uniref:solute carrier family 46 member 3-like isoform X2 n=1 Tax=Pristis pectinata TaxID=685728 RepID=UPI00223DFE36|nr:solute carrier family 46 member 3-like isoform X2 [Pristis pectinata]